MNSIKDTHCANGDCGLCFKCDPPLAQLRGLPRPEFNNKALNLEILAEESAEVIEQLMTKSLSRILRIKSKIVRFGIDDFHPKNKVPNRECLTEEIGHFMAMVDILIEDGTLDREALEVAKAEKVKKLPLWYDLFGG